MGTRSILLIRRPLKKVLALWTHYDGYFDGVGKTICDQLRLLLTKYTFEQLVALSEHWEVCCDGPKWDAEHLMVSWEGLRVFSHDPCLDFQFRYTIDLRGKGWVSGRDNRNASKDVITLSFDEIARGVDFSDYIYRDNDEYAETSDLKEMLYEVDREGIHHAISDDE